jgi:hypothetical protein
MPGFAPQPHPATTGQGNGPQFSKIAGMFWPQGDPGKLRQAAQAWRETGQALTAAEGTCHGAANLVVGSNEGPAIDAFSHYWSKWEGGNGYFELSGQACVQMAEALDRYATAVEGARQRVEEIAATAATVLAVGLLLTVVTVGISDVAAAGGAAALTAAAAAVGLDLSATVASIGGTILAGAAIGAAASAVVDTAIQIEHIDVFHDQKSFNWDEMEHSLEIGALTGGAGAGVGLGARALTPFLSDSLPGLSQAANAFGKMPEWMQAGIRGTVVGGGMAAGIDELTTGHVNPLDVALGATSGALGDMVAGGGRTSSVKLDGEIQSKAIQVNGQASLAERNITPDIQTVARETGGTRVGAAFVLKTQDSIAAKMAGDVTRLGLSPDEAAARIKDAVRYTITYPAHGHTSSAEQALASLEQKGYTVDRIKNTWQPGNPYKGVNVVLTSPDGHPFELQFHTPESFQVKQMTHVDYEIFRESTVLAERQAAFDRMAQVSAHLVHPPGVEQLGEPVIYARP